MNLQTKSIFSTNTNLTNFKPLHPGEPQDPNPLHDFFLRLLPSFSRECPYLAKVFYLQLLLRENILIFTEDRVDARDIWLSLSRALDLKKPEIYVVDDKLNMQELLATKNEYQRVLLFDVSKISVDNINKMLNSEAQLSLVGIESPKVSPGTHISDFFSMITMYQQEQSPVGLLDTFNQQAQLESARTFNKKAFNEAVKFNFQIVVQQGQEEGFLKPFLQILQAKLESHHLKVPQSRWKKMLRILKFMAVNKQEGQFKKMALGDFVLCPDFLASSVQQLTAITQVLFEVLLELVPYYGIQKFEKSVKNHFWFSRTHSQFTAKLFSAVERQWVSFFYPCVKFPETACLQSNPLGYRIQGYEKKLMSDHHIQVEPEKKYYFTIEVRTDCKMIVHLGIACYDKLKNIILPVQACRKEGSQVQYLRLEADKIIVKGQASLEKWSNNKEDFAYERAIGIYFNGDINEPLSVSQVVYNQKEPYSKIERPYSGIQLGSPESDQGQIVLSPESKHWFVNYRHLLEKSKSVLMNHFEGGVGCIGVTQAIEKGTWHKIEIPYQGVLWTNSGRNFFPGTRYIRVVVMVNYSEGYPSCEVENKNGVFEFRKVAFGQGSD